jgi:signal transduction histidine kinase
LKKVVDDFLEFLRHRQSAEKPLKWSEVLADAARDLDRTFRDRGVAFRSTVPDGEPAVDLDRVSAYQVAANLLTNAVEASPSGARVEVVSRGGEEGRWAVLTVEDEGPGVPDHLVAQIFHPFFTTKPEGKGLGLAIVQRVVQAAGGRVEVGRSPKGGSLFTLTLPAVPADNVKSS